MLRLLMLIGFGYPAVVYAALLLQWARAGRATPVDQVPIPTFLLLMGLFWIHTAPIAFVALPLVIGCLLTGSSEWCTAW